MRLPAVFTFLATWLAVIASGNPAVAPRPAATDWAQYRGPGQNGAAKAAGLLGDGPIRLELAWKRPLGSGYSAVSVAGDHAVTMFSDGRRDVLLALDADTAQERWLAPPGGRPAATASKRLGV